MQMITIHTLIYIHEKFLYSLGCLFYYKLLEFLFFILTLRAMKPWNNECNLALISHMTIWIKFVT